MCLTAQQQLLSRRADQQAALAFQEGGQVLSTIPEPHHVHIFLTAENPMVFRSPSSKTLQLL